MVKTTRLLIRLALAVPSKHQASLSLHSIHKFRGVRLRSWNSERPLVFVAVVLQTTPGVCRAKDISPGRQHRGADAYASHPKWRPRPREGSLLLQ
jgi:hypothetical protein